MYCIQIRDTMSGCCAIPSRFPSLVTFSKHNFLLCIQWWISFMSTSRATEISGCEVKSYSLALRHWDNVMETECLLPKTKPKKFTSWKYVILVITTIIIIVWYTIYLATLRWVKLFAFLIWCQVTMNHLLHSTSSDCWIVCGSDIAYQVYKVFPEVKNIYISCYSHFCIWVYIWV